MPAPVPAVAVPARRAFTLTELLVAVLILVVVVLAAGRIFGTAGEISRVGQANADVLQTIGAIERQIRNDIANITTEGFIVIQSVSVPNDFHRATSPSAPLIDPTRNADERIRADRLLFFTHGAAPTQQFIGSSALQGGSGDARLRDQATIESRIQYGHGVQLGSRLRPRADAFFFLDNEPLVPWSWDNPGAATQGRSLVVQAFPRRGQELPPVTPPLPPGQTPLINGSQPPAPRWILARQQVLLSDDGRSPFYYRANVLAPPASGPASWGVPNSTVGIWPDTLPNTFNRFLASSRVDVASTTLADIRRLVLAETTFTNRRNRMIQALVFPRAEVATQPVVAADGTASIADLSRLEQMLTSPTLALGCSEFIVEWTYADGTGRVRRTNGSVVEGFQLDPVAEQPWFGLADPDRSVFPLGSAAWPWNWGSIGNTIFPANIESVGTLSGGVQIYTAVFGYNRTDALSAPPVEQPNAALGYTPWPAALRITMTLHDQRGSLERGRTVQFVVPLPRQ